MSEVKKRCTNAQMAKLKGVVAVLPEYRLRELRSYINGLLQVTEKRNE